jgi:hypothetical protein
MAVRAAAFKVGGGDGVAPCEGIEDEGLPARMATSSRAAPQPARRPLASRFRRGPRGHFRVQVLDGSACIEGNAPPPHKSLVTFSVNQLRFAPLSRGGPADVTLTAGAEALDSLLSSKRSLNSER